MDELNTVLENTDEQNVMVTIVKTVVTFGTGFLAGTIFGNVIAPKVREWHEKRLAKKAEKNN